MSRWRWHKDTTHAPVLAALTAAGVAWEEVSAGRWCASGGKPVARGAADLRCYPGGGRVVALELKTPKARKSSAQRVREQDQLAYRRALRAQGVECYEVESPLEALAALGVPLEVAHKALRHRLPWNPEPVKLLLAAARADLDAQVEREQTAVEGTSTPGTHAARPAYTAPAAPHRYTEEELYREGLAPPPRGWTPKPARGPRKGHAPPDTRPACKADSTHGPAVDGERCAACVADEAL